MSNSTKKDMNNSTKQNTEKIAKQTTQQIRESFLDFFNNRGHKIAKSSSLIPINDPSLLFTNAGMVQFKDVFTGKEKRSYTRATSIQKCMRSSDLENVGHTSRHHTFFEMLGNFSFGDYFKEQAIAYAWEFITEVLKIPKDRLLITVHIKDEDSYKIWSDLTGFSSDRIIKISSDDNFWSMGKTGPCGPCTEIFYDHGDHIKGAPPGLGDDGDRFVEIWNIVFMQYEKLDDGSLVDLPKPCVDTGMGLERIAAVIQGKHDNFDIDIFKDLIDECKKLLKINDSTIEGVKINQSEIDDPNIKDDLIAIASAFNATLNVSIRIIVDHLRAASFLISDGILPSNEGRGYVLRRIVRRAVKNLYLINAKGPLFYKLVDKLVQIMGSAYPELKNNQKLIEEVLKSEENSFTKTIGEGLKILSHYLEDLHPEKSSENLPKKFPGEVAFRLYDTYGFPYDLTEEILREKGIEIDKQKFDIEMDKQRSKARSSWSGSGEKSDDNIFFQIKEKNGDTEFLGYSSLECNSHIVAILDKNLKEVDELTDNGFVITKATTFYGEKGGQSGDKGKIFGNGCQADVLDTKIKASSVFVHEVKVQAGSLKNNSLVKIVVDSKMRHGISSHHTAAHILHESLRRVLGEHVFQKGSQVESNILRLDFNNFKALTKQEIEKVEDIVNDQIISNIEVTTDLMSYEDAINNGVIALFSEKYGDSVRVLKIGDFSKELCGGTHVRNTGEIGMFKIIEESSVASGVRRMRAVCGLSFVEHVREKELKFLSKIEQLEENIKKLQREKDSAIKENTLKKPDNIFREVINIDDGSLPARSSSCFSLCCETYLGDLPTKNLRSHVDKIKKNEISCVALVGSYFDKKFSFALSVTDELSKIINAKDLLKELTNVFGENCNGGGRPTLIQGGIAIDSFSSNDFCEILKKSIYSLDVFKDRIFKDKNT